MALPPSRFRPYLCLSASALLFLLSAAWPMIALALAVIADARAPETGYGFTTGQWRMLGYTLSLALISSTLSVLISLVVVIALGPRGGPSAQPVLTSLMAAVLLCPPMVYAFGWERLLPPSINGHIRCIATWTLWAWPIPAMYIGAGWSSVTRHCFEASTLETGPARSILFVALPALRRHIAASFLILFVLFLGDYGVPHACGLRVFATELLGWAANSPHPIDTLWPALLPVSVITVALIGLGLLLRGDASEGASTAAEWKGRPGARAFLPVIFLALISWAAPLTGLMQRLESFAALPRSLAMYRPDLIATLLTGLCAGVVVVLQASAFSLLPRLRSIALLAALFLGAMPGALIGQAMIAAYNRGATGLLYDHWPIVVLAYVCRFGWIGLLAATSMSRGLQPARSNQLRILGCTLQETTQDLIDQAAIDGADRFSILTRILIPMRLPMLLAAVAVAAALSISDVAASAMVRVPSYSPLAHVIIEKFHRLEDDVLISLSLVLVAVSLLSIAPVAIALQRSRGK